MKNLQFYSNSSVSIQNPGLVYEKKRASNFVLESVHFFLRKAIQGHAYSQLLIPENKDKCWTCIVTMHSHNYWYLKIKINVEHWKRFTGNRGCSCKM